MSLNKNPKSPCIYKKTYLHTIVKERKFIKLKIMHAKVNTKEITRKKKIRKCL